MFKNFKNFTKPQTDRYKIILMKCNDKASALALVKALASASALGSGPLAEALVPALGSALVSAIAET